MKSHIRASRIEVEPIAAGQVLKLILSALGATAVIGLTIEAIQSLGEYGRLVADPVFFGANVTHGDGHPVMVIPGFLGNDGYLETMRGWLGRIGYEALASGLSRNTGFKRELLEQLEQRAMAAADESGTGVSIIGHSLGGVYARAIARRNPSRVRHLDHHGITAQARRRTSIGAIHGDLYQGRSHRTLPQSAIARGGCEERRSGGLSRRHGV